DSAPGEGADRGGEATGGPVGRGGDRRRDEDAPASGDRGGALAGGAADRGEPGPGAGVEGRGGGAGQGGMAPDRAPAAEQGAESAAPLRPDPFDRLVAAGPGVVEGGGTGRGGSQGPRPGEHLG